MSARPGKIRFKANLLGPANPKGAAWPFQILPAQCSDELSSRSMTTADGRIAGHPFQATLEPEGEGSHWLKISLAMREATGAVVGATVALEITLTAEEPEPRVPADLRKALATAPKSKAVWSDVSRAARRDWIHWNPIQQESRNTGAPDCDCLLDARVRQAQSQLFRPFRDVEYECS